MAYAPFAPTSYSTGDQLTPARQTEIELRLGNTEKYGAVPFDAFDGANDDAKMVAARTYIRGRTYKPALVSANRSHTFNDTYPLDIQGFTWTGPPGATGREFESGVSIKCPAAGLFSVTSAKDFTLRGLSFEGTSNGAFVVPTSASGSQGIWTDLNIIDCGFKLFGPNFFTGALTRCNFHRWYVNSGTDTVLSVGGSDSSLFTEGVSFMSSASQSTRKEMFNTNGLANTNLGKLYITPQGGRGVVVGNGRMGLTFHDLTITDPNRSGSLQTQGAAITVLDGEGVRFDSPIIFCANAGTTDGNPDPGDITVTGGHDHVFDSPVFVAGYSGSTAPNVGQAALYTTVPVRVMNPISVGNRPKILRQSSAGLITCNDPSWTITTSAA